jgi:hypothetical protein
MFRGNHTPQDGLPAQVEEPIPYAGGAKLMQHSTAKTHVFTDVSTLISAMHNDANDTASICRQIAELEPQERAALIDCLLRACAFPTSR